MKITQKPAEFEPITIIIETPVEADAFVGLMDKAGKDIALTSIEQQLAIFISDTYSNAKLIY
jgi:hypothetical protein